MSYYPSADLSGLPSELANIIAEYDPEVAGKMSRLNKATRRKTEAAYQSHHRDYKCAFDLTLSEIEDFINTDPPKIGIMHSRGSYPLSIGDTVTNYIFRLLRFFTRRDPTAVYKSIKLAVRADLTLTSEDRGKLTGDGIIHAIKRGTDELLEKSYSIWKMPQLDLVSTFRIYQGRQDCTLPVIRRRILDIFDLYVEDYQNEKTDLKTYLIYFYLAMNAFTLGVELPSPGSDNLDDVRKSVDIYIPLVRQALQQLE